MKQTYSFACHCSAFRGGTGTAQSIGGTYTVDGTNFDGSAYSGTANDHSDQRDDLHHPLGDGRLDARTASARATTNAFAAAYVLGNAIGLVVYKVDGGRLACTGLWTIAGKDGNGTEMLTPSKAELVHLREGFAATAARPWPTALPLLFATGDTCRGNSPG